MKAFYNDNEKYVVEWMKNLVAAGLISPGDVSGASIKDIEPWQLIGYTRAHFFAGIAGWHHALNLAGWPKDITTWTGSCPCQPFSIAGKRKGTDDERHLWPVFANLINECGPAVIFGEQVASPDGKTWLAGVQADLEGMGYLFAAADLCAASVGAPHIRQRLYWVAYAKHAKHAIGRAKQQEHGNAHRGNGFGGRGELSGLEHVQSDGRSKRWAESGGRSTESRCELSGLADANGGIARNGELQSGREYGQQQEDGRTSGLGNPHYQGPQGRLIGGDRARERLVGPTGVGFWERSDTILCADGKRRRIESGTFPLANGVSARVGKLRAYGNAICPPLAAEFISSFMEAVGIEPIR